MNKEQLKQMGFSTKAIHGGAKKNEYGALATPIYQSSTFVFLIQQNKVEIDLL